MQTNLLVSIASVFFLSIFVGLTLYLVGWIIGAKSKKTEGKVAPYACGEDLSPLRLQIDVEKFFIYAVYFLIFDILAFILATSLYTPGYFPIIYALVVLMAVVALISRLRR